jgi:hypothetical protein
MSRTQNGVWLIEDYPSVANTFIAACSQLSLPFFWSHSYEHYKDHRLVVVHSHSIVFIDNSLEEGKEDVGYAIACKIRELNPKAKLVSSTFDRLPVRNTDYFYDKNKYCDNIDQTREFIKSLL